MIHPRHRKILLDVLPLPTAPFVEGAAVAYLERFCQEFIYSDAIDGIRSRRPDPRPYRELIIRLGVRAPQIVFVADNPLKDFIRARQLGLVTIRVLTGEYAHYDYPSLEHTADYDIGSVAGLPQLMEELPAPPVRAQNSVEAENLAHPQSQG